MKHGADQPTDRIRMPGTTVQALPDFVLVSPEGYGLAEPRACYVVRRVTVGNQTDALLVRLDPAVVMQLPAGGDLDVGVAIVVARHEGASVTDVQSWPIHVHVLRPLVIDVEKEVYGLDDVQNVAWAELLPRRQRNRLGD